MKWDKAVSVLSGVATLSAFRNYVDHFYPNALTSTLAAKITSFLTDEAEIAQSESANGVPFAHFTLLRHFKVDGAKMSKSKGNMYTLEDITDRGFDHGSAHVFLPALPSANELHVGRLAQAQKPSYYLWRAGTPRTEQHRRYNTGHHR